eukprot:TRINITY_DN23254_c0_g1_i8.p1 TRINITY_DN23254_c0_g1~~TRINITY_DN23254_c0_g1_i8.p1  ORF type:complete len:668 (-),score=108.17 TRINITY_DN23254_c0_g1_i8:29-2032(-)
MERKTPVAMASTFSFDCNEPTSLGDVIEVIRRINWTELILGPKTARPLRRRRTVVSAKNPRRMSALRLVSHPVFCTMVTLAILFNMCLIIAQADVDASDQEAPYWISLSSTTLMWLYAFEVMMKIYAHGWSFFVEASDVFDLVVVLVDVIAFVTAASDGGDHHSVGFLRSFKLLRIYRLVNSVCVFRELVLMMKGLQSAMRAIVFGTLMICFALTSWSILTVQFLHPLVTKLAERGEFNDCKDCADAFSSAYSSTLTLWKTIVAGDSWGAVAIPLLTHFPMSGLILIPAYVSVQLGLVNVIVAVIVDRQAQAREDDDKLASLIQNEQSQKSYDKLRALFESLDADGGGSLSLDELRDSYEKNTEFRTMLDVLDIKKSDIPIVFEIMDADGSGDVSYEEFCERLHHLRFLNKHTVLALIQQHCDVLRRQMVAVQVRAEAFQQEIRDLCGSLKADISRSDEKQVRKPTSIIKHTEEAQVSDLSSSIHSNDEQATETDSFEESLALPAAVSQMDSSWAIESDRFEESLALQAAESQMDALICMTEKELEESRCLSFLRNLADEGGSFEKDVTDQPVIELLKAIDGSSNKTSSSKALGLDDCARNGFRSHITRIPSTNKCATLHTSKLSQRLSSSVEASSFYETVSRESDLPKDADRASASCSSFTAPALG